MHWFVCRQKFVVPATPPQSVSVAQTTQVLEQYPGKVFGVYDDTTLVMAGTTVLETPDTVDEAMRENFSTTLWSSIAQTSTPLNPATPNPVDVTKFMTIA